MSVYEDDAQRKTYEGLRLFYVEHFEKAIEAFSEAIALDPGQAMAHEYRALAFRRLGKEEEAQADAAKAASLKQAGGLRKPAKYYTSPDGAYIAAYGGFWQRFAASFIDWVLCFWIPLYAIGFAMRATILSNRNFDDGLVWLTALLPLLGLVILAYFTYFLGRGRSPGMMVTGLRVVNVSNGEPPGLRRGLVKAFLNIVLVAGGFWLWTSMWTFGDPVARAASTLVDLVVYITSGVLVAVLGILGRLWMIWDARKQTWQDRLAGVVVVGGMSPSPGVTNASAAGRRRQ